MCYTTSSRLAYCSGVATINCSLCPNLLDVADEHFACHGLRLKTLAAAIGGICVLSLQKGPFRTAGAYFGTWW